MNAIGSRAYAWAVAWRAALIMAVSGRVSILMLGAMAVPGCRQEMSTCGWLLGGPYASWIRGGIIVAVALSSLWPVARRMRTVGLPAWYAVTVPLMVAADWFFLVHQMGGAMLFGLFAVPIPIFASLALLIAVLLALAPTRSAANQPSSLLERNALRIATIILCAFLVFSLLSSAATFSGIRVSIPQLAYRLLAAVGHISALILVFGIVRLIAVSRAEDGQETVNGSAPSPTRGSIRQAEVAPDSYRAPLARQIAAGCAVLLVVYLVLLFFPLPMFWLFYLGNVFGNSMTTIFITFAIGMVLWAAGTRRTGIAIAPLVFCALWFSVSVAHRTYVAATTSPSVDGNIPTEIAGGTLIFDGGVPCCGQFKLLAEGLVARVVQVTAHGDGKPATIEEYTHHKDADCAGRETTGEQQLAKAGRVDECIVQETLTSLPDGLVLRSSGRAGRSYKGEFIVRENGDERTVASWVSGELSVVSYFPLMRFAVLEKPTSLWAPAATGPAQRVTVGRQRFGLENMAEAVTGIVWTDAIAQADVPRAS